MLQVFRDSMKYLAWILWVVIAIFVLFVFVDFGRGSRFGNGGGQDAAATVGKQKISYREYEDEYRRLENQMRERLGQQYTSELAEQLQLPMQALNQLVSRKILLREASKLDLAVSDAELRRYIVHLPVFQDGEGTFAGAEAYQQAVRRLGFTTEGFEQSIREQLVLQRVLDALEKSVVVSDAAVEERYRQQVERAKIRYVSIAFAASVGQVAVSDAELQKYFDKHAEVFRVPEQRVADYLLVDQAALEQTLPATEEELRAYYQQHQQEYQQSEQVRARHILVDTAEQAAAARARLDSGEDFAKVAREVSKDAAANGGDLGWFGRGRMVPPFEEAAFGAAVGAVVGPVRTQFGYHLIQVQEKRAAASSPFEEVRQAVRARFAAERAAQLAEAKAKTLAAELAKAGTKSGQKMKELAAQQPGLETGSTEPFGRQGSIVPLGAAPSVNGAVFGLAEVGGVTEPLRTPRGWVVLRLAEVKAPHLPALAEVREAVRRGAEQDKQRQQAFDRLQAARQALGPGARLDAIAAHLGMAVQESQEFGQGALVQPLGYAPELVKEAMAKPVGALVGPVSVAGSAVLYEVASRHGMDPAAFAKQKDGLRQQLEQEQVGSLITSLINMRKQELGVTYDPQLVKQLGLAKQGQQAG